MAQIRIEKNWKKKKAGMKKFLHEFNLVDGLGVDFIEC